MKNQEKIEAPATKTEQVAADEQPPAQDRKRHERLLRPRLDHDEGGEHEGGAGKKENRLRRFPAGIGRRDDRVDKRNEACCDGHRPKRVEPALAGSARCRG